MQTLLALLHPNVLHFGKTINKSLWSHAASAGAQINVHSERKPQRFQAVVSGMDATSVAAERHFSPRKVSLGLPARS